MTYHKDWNFNHVQPGESKHSKARQVGCDPGAGTTVLNGFSTKEMGTSTNPENLTCPLKRDYFNRKYIWTNHWFSGDMLVLRGVSQKRGMDSVRVFDPWALLTTIVLWWFAMNTCNDSMWKDDTFKITHPFGRTTSGRERHVIVISCIVWFRVL